ncbi:hypothetical protein WJX73_003028 [Symbiochloris irregularis]|uniref:Uncharacterized protein n=1 Tax=Symbiochloris irregularis TaxID=706552 RepID=A0AAW1PCG3_9CHLO
MDQTTAMHDPVAPLQITLQYVAHMDSTAAFVHNIPGVGTQRGSGIRSPAVAVHLKATQQLEVYRMEYIGESGVLHLTGRVNNIDKLPYYSRTARIVEFKPCKERRVLTVNTRDQGGHGYSPRSAMRKLAGMGNSYEPVSAEPSPAHKAVQEALMQLAGLAMWFCSEGHKDATWIHFDNVRLGHEGDLTLGHCNVASAKRSDEQLGKVTVAASGDSSLWGQSILWG